MFKRKLTISDFLLIAVNLIPLYGVWFEGWDAAMVFLVYCLESVIIGIVTVLKMAVVALVVRPGKEEHDNSALLKRGSLFLVVFFILHYGVFIFIQTQLFFGVSGIGGNSMTYKKIPALLGSEGRLLLLIFIVYYTVQSFFEFFANGQYKKASLLRLMFQPYWRIIVQQVIVIAGSMFLSFGLGEIFIVIVTVVRTFAELYLNSFFRDKPGARENSY